MVSRDQVPLLGPIPCAVPRVRSGRRKLLRGPGRLRVSATGEAHSTLTRLRVLTSAERVRGEVVAYPAGQRRQRRLVVFEREGDAEPVVLLGPELVKRQ